MKTKLFPIVLLSLGLAGCWSNPRKDQRTVSIDISPDKKSIVFSAVGKHDSDLFILDLATQKARLLSALRGNELTPHFSPDGKKITFALTDLGYKTSAIHEIELATGKVTKILDNGPYFDYHPIYGSDGSEIYFNRAHRRRPYSFGGYVWDQWDLYKAQKDKPIRLTESLYYQLYKPSFNVTTGDVFFSVYKDKETSICRLDSHGSLTTYRERGSWATMPRTLGSLIYIEDHNQDFDYELYRANNSDDDKKLTNMKSYLRHPCISLDGQDIYFLSDLHRNNRCELYRIKSDGTQLTKLAGSEFFDNPLASGTTTL